MIASVRSLTSIKQAVNFVPSFLCSAHIMYRNFFSLSELPFSISPDPKYLFMSERHKEALAHLTYGLGEVGGFALLTGEVGTGKTTISRCLMEQLPDNTQAAFILNPTLSSQELLATLCDQLKISYLKTDASLKNLTDKISEKLLENHANDINTLLIIDEAQHLQPEVLEQLRLLTNLETNTKKLLQVILIGQPELQHLLQRRDLRQLAQRITARYHLLPLTKQELCQYIQHRLMVADCVRSLFDKGALNKIHQLSQGVPRLTNLLCHSALMQAYNQNDSVVNKKTVMAAAERALGSDLSSKPGSHRYNPVLVLSTALSFTAFIALAAYWWGQTQVAVSNTVGGTSHKSLIIPDKTSADVDELAIKTVILVNEEPLQATTLVKKSDNIDITLGTENRPATDVQHKAEAEKVETTADMASSTRIDSSSDSDKMIVMSAQDINKSRQNKSNVSYQLTDVEGVSSDLLARFQAAIDETEVENSPNSQISNSHLQDSRNSYNSLQISNNQAVKPLNQMSKQIQNALPSLNFEQHIYASDGQGWVNVNGRDRYEGDYIGNNLLVEKILPQQVILSFKGESFSLPALTNWH